MAIVVTTVDTMMEASSIESAIEAGTFAAGEVIAVIAKTEGNGGVNDLTRILADQAFRGVLRKLGNRGADIARIHMVWSDGCDGVVTPHATVFAGNARPGRRVAHRHRHSHERGTSAEDIGRPW